MKTYLYNLFDRLSKFNQELDVSELLCSKSWCAITEDNFQKQFLFERDGNVIISINGDFRTYKWAYNTHGNALIIYYTKQKGTLFKLKIVNEDIIVLKKENVSDFIYLIENETTKNEEINTIADVENMLEGLKEEISDEDSLDDEPISIEDELEELRERKKSLSAQKSKLSSFISARIDFHTQLQSQSNYEREIKRLLDLHSNILLQCKRKEKIYWVKVIGMCVLGSVILALPWVILVLIVSGVLDDTLCEQIDFLWFIIISFIIGMVPGILTNYLEEPFIFCGKMMDVFYKDSYIVTYYKPFIIKNSIFYAKYFDVKSHVAADEMGFYCNKDNITESDREDIIYAEITNFDNFTNKLTIAQNNLNKEIQDLNEEIKNLRENNK